MAALGSYTTHLQALNNIDGRMKEGRILKSMRQELTRLLDHPANAAELALIERMAWMQLRLAVLDARSVEGTFTSMDADVYNAHCNSLARGLQKLGLLPGSQPQPPADPMAALRAHIAAAT